MPKKNLIRVVVATGTILLVTFITMQFTPEMNWDLFDFIVFGVLVLIFGLLLDIVIRRSGKYQIIGAVAVMLLFFWVWVELAVGVFTKLGN